jgi:formylglycine-generating enzyme required for sulfatase activity
MGLMPLGPDPASGLWEFAHLLTGEPAERDSDGQLLLRKETGVVLVLIPAGNFWMGAQPSDPNRRNYDPQALTDEGPEHEVELSAYFISKYEMTQSQWTRLTGRNPSIYRPGHYYSTFNSEGRDWNPMQPVETLSWLDCMVWLPRAGLALPSEAQWENGCRGGTSYVYWCGNDMMTLQGVANLSDCYGKEHGNDGWESWEPWLDDGNTAHSVVGSYRANAYGLHDVHGNIWEWCLDGWDGSFYSNSPSKDPVAPWKNAATRVSRGGSFGALASLARSAKRLVDTSSYAGADLGVRPARPLD